MSAQAKQYLDWSKEVDYPLSSSGTLPVDAILDARGFTRVPPDGTGLLLQSITGSGDSLVVHLAYGTADPDVGSLDFTISINTASLRAGTTTSETITVNIDSPWIPGGGFLLAGLSLTFGPGIVDQSGWTPGSPLAIEPALMVDLSSQGIYRLRARRIVGGVSSLVDLGGDLVFANGYNATPVADQALGRLFFDVDRGFGEGIHVAGWPTGVDGDRCEGLVRTIDGAPPDALGIMEFIGEGGVEIVPDAPNHKLTIRIGRTSQTGVKC